MQSRYVIHRDTKMRRQRNIARAKSILTGILLLAGLYLCASEFVAWMVG